MEQVALNVTTSAVSSMSGSWFSIFILVGFATIILSLFVMALSSFENYAKTRRWIMWLLGTFKYFIFGILTLLTLAVPVLIFYYFINQANKGNTAPISITLIIVFGYALTSLIGYLANKFVYNRIKKFEKKVEVKHG